MNKKIVDWQQLALNLRRHGSLETYSLRLGKSEGYLYDMAREKFNEPSHSVGDALLRMHTALCGEASTHKLYKR